MGIHIFLLLQTCVPQNDAESKGCSTMKPGRELDRQRILSPVNIAPMACFYNIDNKLFLLDFIKNPIISDPDSIGVFRTFELFSA